MKTTTSWNCGNFTLLHGADIADAIVPSLVEVGLLHLMQRNTGIDKALGIIKTVNGKPVRSKLKRVDVAYSDDIAQALNDALDSFTVKNGSEEIKVAVLTSVERYDRETLDSKFTRERGMAAEMESGKDFDAKAARCFKAAGLPATTPTHGADGEYSPEFLAAIRARVKELSAASNI